MTRKDAEVRVGQENTLCDKNKVVFKGNLLQNPLIGSNRYKRGKNSTLSSFKDVKQDHSPKGRPDNKKTIQNVCTEHLKKQSSCAPLTFKTLNCSNQSGFQTTRDKHGTVGAASSGPGWEPELIRDDRAVPVLVMGGDRLVEVGEPHVLR